MQLTSPALAHRFLRWRLSIDVEEFWAVALNADKHVIRSACLFRGSVDQCLFHPRDVFRFAFRHNASSVLVAHNHPSGNVAPSAQDEAVTEQLLLAAFILQLPVDDHLIIAGRDYFSFLQAGRMPPIGSLAPNDRSLG